MIDMGPEGGDRGGEVVTVGTPETVAKHPQSHTGRFLQSVLVDQAVVGMRKIS